MNALVSIIIPTKNSATTLDACLASVTSQSYTNIEVIVVDNASSDTTIAIAHAHNATVAHAGNERSAQRNKGAHISKGNYLMFVDSDMELSKDVIQNCVHVMQHTVIIQAIVIPEESIGNGFWAECKRFERLFYINIPWMQACRFFRKSSFEAVGGFDTDCIGTEDFDIHNRIVYTFGATSVESIDSHIIHSEGTLTLRTLWRKKYYYGKGLRPYTLKNYNRQAFQEQSSLVKRIGVFMSKPARILRTPHLFIGTICMKTVEFIAGGIGYYTTI